MMNDFQAAYRILDANANRASEGLRTLEEIARMAIENLVLSTKLKTVRHDLQDAIAGLDPSKLLEARDTAHDIGTTIGVPQESSRSNLLSIAQAATGRLQQSIRCLEEFSKVVAPNVADRFEAIRYRIYDLNAEMLLTLGRRESREFPSETRLYLLCDCSSSLELFSETLRSLCKVGVDVVQIRDKKVDDRKLLEYAREAQEITKENRSLLIMNDRIDIALALDADGIHLGQEDLPIRVARKIVGDRMYVGVSTHDLEQAIAAEAEGADYIGCGPTFVSKTKAFPSFAGVEFLRQIAQRITIPAFAIGGIDLSNLQEVIDAGVFRIAVQGSLLQANEPAIAAADFASRLKEAAAAREF